MKLPPLQLRQQQCRRSAAVVVAAAAALPVEDGFPSELVLSAALLNPLSLMMLDVDRLLQQTAEPVPRPISTTAYWATGVLGTARAYVKKYLSPNQTLSYISGDSIFGCPPRGLSAWFLAGFFVLVVTGCQCPM